MKQYALFEKYKLKQRIKFQAGPDTKLMVSKHPLNFTIVRVHVIIVNRRKFEKAFFLAPTLFVIVFHILCMETIPVAKIFLRCLTPYNYNTSYLMCYKVLRMQCERLKQINRFYIFSYTCSRTNKIKEKNRH